MIVCGKMKLHSGKFIEYKERHDNIWFELKQEILNHGVNWYHIYFDEETNILFSILDVKDLQKWEEISKTSICKKWWDFMKDIMETNSDNSPVFKNLTEAFSLTK